MISAEMEVHKDSLTLLAVHRAGRVTSTIMSDYSRRGIEDARHERVNARGLPVDQPRPAIKKLI